MRHTSGPCATRSTGTECIRSPPRSTSRSRPRWRTSSSRRCIRTSSRPRTGWGRRRVAAGAGSAAAGGITFAIVQKVTAKVLGKQVLELAAKAPLKAAAGKLAGAVAGGAALGSLLPGAGTAVGAVVGGALVGASLGVAVDGALLELEEALSRDDFERELAAAVRQARDEFAGEYLGRPAEGASGRISAGRG